MESKDVLVAKNFSRSITTRARRKIWLEKEKTDIRLRCYVTYALLSIFGLNTLCVLTFILLGGLGVMTLDIKVILTLIGETIAHAAGMFYMVTRYLFPSKSG